MLFGLSLSLLLMIRLALAPVGSFAEFHPLCVVLLVTWAVLGMRFFGRKFWLQFGSTVGLATVAELWGTHYSLHGAYYFYPETAWPSVLSQGIVAWVGVLWFMIAFPCFLVAKLVHERTGRIGLAACVGAALMTSVDFVLDPHFVRHGMWVWQTGIAFYRGVPAQNYLCWFYGSAMMIGSGLYLLRDRKLGWPREAWAPIALLAGMTAVFWARDGYAPVAAAPLLVSAWAALFVLNPRDRREIAFLTALLGVHATLFAWIAHTTAAWQLALACVVGAAAIIQGVMFFHDCVHRAAFSRPSLNLWIGRLVGALYGVPFSFIADQHLKHHRHAGEVAIDPEILDPTESAARGRGELMFFHQLTRVPLLGSVLAPLLGQYQRFIAWSMGALRAQDRSTLRALTLELSLAAAWLAALALLFGPAFLSVFIWGLFVPGLLGLSVVYYMSFPLHARMVGEDMTGRPTRERTLLVTRTIESNRWVQALVANLNFHIEHHLHPSASRWDLPRKSREIREELKAYASSKRLPFAVGTSYTRWYRKRPRQRYNPITSAELWERYGDF